VEIPERWARAIRSAGFRSVSALANEARLSTNQVLALLSGEEALSGHPRRSLASALRLTGEELDELAGAVEEEPDPFIVPKGSEGLSPRQRAVVTELILTFIESNRALSERDRATPPAPPASR
jgi:hypothetical protein